MRPKQKKKHAHDDAAATVGFVFKGDRRPRQVRASQYYSANWFEDDARQSPQDLPQGHKLLECVLIFPELWGQKVSACPDARSILVIVIDRTVLICFIELEVTLSLALLPSQ